MKTERSLHNMVKSLDDKYPMYTNPGVTAITEKIGPFKYEQPKNDGVKRVTKEFIILENKSKY